MVCAVNDSRHEQPALHLTLGDGPTIAVPASLSAITTYVLLEQEAWFEKEINFLRNFLKPGMTAIDIGSNLGVYTLPIARWVGSEGSLCSYEPGSEARAFLEKSKNLNDLTSHLVLGVALSDSRKEGYLASAASTELRALGPAGSGEPVHITSLDLENAERGWRSVDFVKIDAEGEEERIIAGGRGFFADHSPLVMFEIKSGDKVNERLRAVFPGIGYRVFRQLAGAPILVPDDAKPLDGYELNLFAAKPDRADALAREGLLADTIPRWSPETAASGNAGLPEADYDRALHAFAMWRATDQPVSARCGALAAALSEIRTACARSCTPERASTWARIAFEWGARGESIMALQQLLSMMREKQPLLREPFLPASSRFDAIAASEPAGDWFAVAAAEQYERTYSFSSIFSGPSPFLVWLCGQRLAAAEMLRRQMLIMAKAGHCPRVPERLCVPAADHLNAAVWRAGMVPGTVV
jgi:FkbM family methyltransferase